MSRLYKVLGIIMYLIYLKFAVLLVTHDSRILDIADRILRMEDGRVTIRSF
ncbi:hypothetical protein DSM106972_046050 [Dulcicalothrix desertica PCC 7102]|uniref:ABC transporter ATP-binding protein n=1 Tax=Dulcicalothrix desertica PCC 7102 TaxID=232991 RepID=A0A3S1D6H6_9CYAN|nr:hypothetical protein DSM106972_046050 [Dulcicalothrix desertica PCC 7102]